MYTPRIESQSKTSWCPEWRQSARNQWRYSREHGKDNVTFSWNSATLSQSPEKPRRIFLISCHTRVCMNQRQVASGLTDSGQCCTNIIGGSLDGVWERERVARNLTPDDKRIEESQQSAAREMTDCENESARRGWSLANRESLLSVSWRDHLAPRWWSHHRCGTTPTSILQIPRWFKRRDFSFSSRPTRDVRHRSNESFRSQTKSRIDNHEAKKIFARILSFKIII